MILASVAILQLAFGSSCLGDDSIIPEDLFADEPGIATKETSLAAGFATLVAAIALIPPTCRIPL